MRRSLICQNMPIFLICTYVVELTCEFYELITSYSVSDKTRLPEFGNPMKISQELYHIFESVFTIKLCLQ